MSGGFAILLAVLFWIYKSRGGKDSWDVPVVDKLINGFGILIGLCFVGGIALLLVQQVPKLGTAVGPAVKDAMRGVGGDGANAGNANGGAAAASQPKPKESRQQLEAQERALLHKKDMLKQSIPYHEKEIARLRERKVEWSRRYDETLRRKDFGMANQMMFDGSKYETQVSEQEMKISDIRGDINAVDKELEEVYKKLLQAK
jgi:hypothetical protein